MTTIARSSLRFCMPPRPPTGGKQSPSDCGVQRGMPASGGPRVTSRASHPMSRLARSGLRRCPIVGAAGFVASCRQAGVLDPQGPIAAAERLLLINATEIMLVGVVPVILATLGVAWWYRSSNTRATRNPDWSYQGSIEFVVWSIPALVVILLGGVCWIGAHQLDPRAPIPSDIKPLQVD